MQNNEIQNSKITNKLVQYLKYLNDFSNSNQSRDDKGNEIFELVIDGANLDAIIQSKDLENDVFFSPEGGKSILEYCAVSPNRNNLDLILSLSANPNIKARDGRNIIESLLDRAIDYDLTGQIIKIIQYPRTNLNIKTKTGTSLLNYTLGFVLNDGLQASHKEQYLKIAKEIVRFGADINEDISNTFFVLEMEQIWRDLSNKGLHDVDNEEIKSRARRNIDELIQSNKESKSIKDQIKKTKIVLLGKLESYKQLLESYKQLNNENLAHAIKNKDFNPDESMKQIIKFKVIDKSINTLLDDLKRSNSNLVPLIVAEKYKTKLQNQLDNKKNEKLKTDAQKKEINAIKSQIYRIDLLIEPMTQNAIFRNDKIKRCIDKLRENDFSFDTNIEACSLSDVKNTKNNKIDKFY